MKANTDYIILFRPSKMTDAQAFGFQCKNAANELTGS
jgi:hypothetical protein